MEFILDTNAYRNLIEGKTIDEVYDLSQELIECEEQQGHVSALSIVVAMELISRLGQSDPAKERCFKALCLLYFHHRRRTVSGFSGLYYPPLNVILSQFFFGTNSKYHHLYGKVLHLTNDLTKTLNINECDNYAKEVGIVKNQIIFEKREFQNNVEDLLKSINYGSLDWQYFAKHKEEQKQFKMKIEDGRMHTLLGLSLFKRAHQLVDVYRTSLKAAAKLESFFATYKAALIMNCSILTSIAEGSEWLGDINDSKWNTLNDVQIMFGLLYERPGVDKRLVTDEKKILNSCKKAGLGHLVISLNDYKTAIRY